MAENTKTINTESEEDVDALLESCEQLLVTDDKPGKDGDKKESTSEGSLTEEEKIVKEIKKSLEAFGKLGSELGGDFAVDFQKEFAKVTSEGDGSSEARAALDGLPDLMNALQMVAGEVEKSGEANLPKFAGSQEDSENTGRMQDEELDKLHKKMQLMFAMFSKDIFTPALKDMGEKYPKWLEENKPKLPDSEAHRYEQQYEIVKSILAHIDKYGVGNEEEYMLKFASLLEEMQKFGLPPIELLGNDPLANFDGSAALEQCSVM